MNGIQANGDIRDVEEYRYLGTMEEAILRAINAPGDGAKNIA